MYIMLVEHTFMVTVQCSALILPFLRRYQSPQLSHDLWHPTEYTDMWYMCNKASLVPRPIPSFSMLHAEERKIEKLGMGLGARLQ